MDSQCPKCQFENPDDSKFCKECGTQIIPSEEIPASPTKTFETPREEFTRGTTFAGRYEIIEELGKGGMGKVFRVEDKKIEEEIALKVIKPEIASDEETIERFSNELKITRKIAHRNICKMFDLGDEEGIRYITMEYIPGENLKNMIKMTKQLSLGAVVNIGKQLCEGLSEAHRLGVVHRDLKPSNIIIDKKGNARILDFGIALSMETKGLTGAKVMIGTPEYMSPEQVETSDVDQRSDIYSLGVIMYEMMTGSVPFKGDTPLSIVLKHKMEKPPDPRQLNAQIPEDLSQVILKCLEKEREKRHESADEVFSELSRIEKDIFPVETKILKKKLEKKKGRKLKWKNSLFYSGAVVLVALIIIGGLTLFTGRQEAIDSIAVLPLENLSGDPEQEYFADGMTEALIYELTKITGIQRVISRTSVMRYKKVSMSMPEIARELNVDVVVEGSVLLIGERVRITAQLIEAKTDRPLWTDSYERDLSNVLALQRELARTIAHEIKIAVTPEEETHLKMSPLVNPDAYHLYLKGRFFWNRRTADGLKKAIEFFDQAIEKDPNYAVAYAGLADSYNLLPWFSPFPPKDAFPKGKRAAMRALEIDDTLSEAHASLGLNKTAFEWDWAAAEEEFKRAIELNPGYATAHQWYAWSLAWMSRFDEAIEEMKRAQELDPLSLIINTDVGVVFFFARQYDLAIESLQKAIEMDPTFSHAHHYLGRAYVQKSMYTEALEAFQKEKEFSRGWDPMMEPWIVITYVKMNKRDQAQRMLDDLVERSKQLYIPPSGLAWVYFVLEENELGFDYLNKAFAGRDQWLCYLNVDPVFDSVRSDPRFKVLLGKMNLEK